MLRTFEVDGLRMYEEFVPAQYTDLLFEYVDSLPYEEPEGGAARNVKRLVQHYGFLYDYTLSEPRVGKLRRGPAIPPILDCLGKIMVKYGLMRNSPNQVIVNRYSPGEGIGAHRDHNPIFDNDVATLSLGSKWIMRFEHHRSQILHRKH